MNNDNNHPINKIMEEALNKIKSIIDVNTVIGAPMTTMDGLTIISITKVCVGFVAGGGEYSQNIPPKKQKENYPFAGGSGAGFNVTPIGFLIGRDGNFKFISVENRNSFEKILKTINELIGKIKDK